MPIVSLDLISPVQLISFVHVFPKYMNEFADSNLPPITTIFRFHKLFAGLVFDCYSVRLERLGEHTIIYLAHVVKVIATTSWIPDVIA
jgi:hypothetical protein